MSKKLKVLKLTPDFKLKTTTVEKKEPSGLSLKKELEYLSIGWYIVIPILLFIGIGKFLVDKEVVPEKALLFFVLAGIISLVYNLGHILKKLEKNGREN